jgi:hypothetical protein
MGRGVPTLTLLCGRYGGGEPEVGGHGTRTSFVGGMGNFLRELGETGASAGVGFAFVMLDLGPAIVTGGNGGGGGKGPGVRCLRTGAAEADALERPQERRAHFAGRGRGG